MKIIENKYQHIVDFSIDVVCKQCNSKLCVTTQDLQAWELHGWWFGWPYTILTFVCEACKAENTIERSSIPDYVYEEIVRTERPRDWTLARGYGLYY